DRWKLGERPNAIAEESAQKPLEDIQLPPVEDKNLPPVQRLRLHYTKRGLLKFLSHLDLIRVLNMIMSRAGVPVAFTQGFHPQPRLQYSPPLSLGFESDDDVADVYLVREMSTEDLLRTLNECTINDLEFTSCEPVSLGSESVEESIVASEFEVIVNPELLGASEMTQSVCENLVERFMSGAPMPIKISKKNRVLERDAREGLLEFRLGPKDESGIRFEMKIAQESGRYINPLDLLGGLFGRPLCLGDDLEVRRTRVILAAQTTSASLAKA
ncbi:MAG: TIGR03936 family radical SAM-associated protein, partial [bacterium]